MRTLMIIFQPLLLCKLFRILGVAQAYQKGIPVIVLDRRVLGNQYTCFIGADNKKIGRAAVKWIAGLYPTGGKEAVEIALDILNDKKVAKEITLSSRVFTRYNINQGGELLSQ